MKVLTNTSMIEVTKIWYDVESYENMKNEPKLRGMVPNIDLYNKGELLNIKYSTYNTPVMSKSYKLPDSSTGYYYDESTNEKILFRKVLLEHNKLEKAIEMFKQALLESITDYSVIDLRELENFLQSIRLNNENKRKTKKNV